MSLPLFQVKNGDKQMQEQKFVLRQGGNASKRLRAFSFGGRQGGRGRGRWIFFLSFVPKEFSSSSSHSQCVLQHVSNSTTLLSQSFSLFTYINEPKERHSVFQKKLLFCGPQKSFGVFFFGFVFVFVRPIKMARYKGKKKVERERHTPI